ncbi:CWF19-like protein 1, partial [Asbolus verrucosus]
AGSVKTLSTGKITEEIRTAAYSSEFSGYHGLLQTTIAVEPDKVDCSSETLPCGSEGYFRFNQSCTDFYECHFNTECQKFLSSPIETCPKCLKFNAKKMRCDFPWNVPECGNLHNIKMKENYCTAPGKYFVPDDCHKYYECIENSNGTIDLTVKTCPSPLKFNKNDRQCAEEDDIPVRPECESPNLYVGDLFDCRKFYRCNGGKPLITLYCPENAIFNGHFCERKSDSHLLLCGDVEGKFNALFSRVSNINTKSGPFDCLFCVGNFFGVNNKEFELYKSGERKAPIPTYILGPNSAEHANLYPDDDSVELCENVYCLGKRGVYTDSKGIRVAYISGISSKESNKHEYSSKDVAELYNACVRGNASFRGIDILLTAQWPSGITKNDPKKIALAVNKTSDLPSWLVLKLKPRYHISGLEGIYYERSPFRCPNLGDHDTTLNIVTRFLGLARVGNPNKEKWLYALNLTPLDKMKIAELLQKTTDETECPFDFTEIDHKIFNTKRKSAGASQYFYDTNAHEESDYGRRRPKRQKIEFDQSKCWFCLSSPSVEKHLIVTVGNATYLALAKGGIVDEHLLISPIEHHQNSLGLPEAALQEMNQFKEALRNFYGRDERVAVFFERNYKTSHMQLQAVPIPKQAVKELKEIFIDEAEARGLKLEVLESRNRLDQVVQANVPFFTVELPDGVVLYTRIKGNFPLNFAREVLVSGPVLNLDERSDWKDCILKKGAEEVLVQRLRTDFEPFDFTDS